MPTPGQIFDELVNNAREAEKAAAQPQAPAPEVAQGLNELTDYIRRQDEARAAMDARLKALEGTRVSQPQAPTNDPYAALEAETGIARDRFAVPMREEARREAERLFEEKFGPVVREAQAIQEYQATNPKFNMNEFNQYVATHPDVAAIVREAAGRGAYRAGIEYAETRRALDSRIAEEAKGQAKVEARKQYVERTRPDAQVVGAAGSPTGSGNVSPAPMTPEQLSNIYAHANAGNWTPFEKAFHQSHLPSEEEFQRMVQGPLA